MRCLAHISDLHFGSEEHGLTEALLAELHEQQPSLIAISGDFTQRARRSQYRAACEFIARLPAPWIGVPGNHDVPLYDVPRRFISPLGRYRHFISPELNPLHEDPELMLLGLNTARSLTWKSGRISREQLARIRACLGAPSEKFKILMTHHPFIPPAGDEISGIDVVGRAGCAIPVLDDCRIDLLLAGHLHQGYSGNISTHYPHARRAIISVQAGTAISKRRRNEPNAYNLVRLDRTNIRIDLRLFRDGRFGAGQRVEYCLRGENWELVKDATVPGSAT